MFEFEFPTETAPEHRYELASPHYRPHGTERLDGVRLAYLVIGKGTPIVRTPHWFALCLSSGALAYFDCFWVFAVLMLMLVSDACY